MTSRRAGHTASAHLRDEGDDGRVDRQPARSAIDSAPRSMPRESRRPPTDPFFDQPYEPSATAAEPSWEKRTAAPSARGLSPNIKPKKRVAALFGGKVPEPAES